MSILIPVDDQRGPKAIQLATQALAAGWPWLRAYYMPSRSDPTRVYVTTRAFCTCADFKYRGHIRECHHTLAVRLLDELANEVAAF